MVHAEADPPRHRDAIEDFDRALAIDPHHVEAMTGRAIVQGRDGDTGAARQTLEAVATVDPRSRDLLLSRAVLSRQEGESARAVAELGRLLELYPDDKEALITRGHLRISTDANYEAALADFDRAVSLVPDDPSGYFGRALCRSAADDWGSALADLDVARELEQLPGSWSTPALIDLRRGDILLVLGRAEEAVGAFDCAIAHDRATGEEVARARAGRGRANLARGRAELAVIDLGHALAAEPPEVEQLRQDYREALGALSTVPQARWAPELREEVERGRVANQELLAGAPLEDGWLDEQLQAISARVSGTEQLLHVCRCSRREDVRRHVAFLVTSGRAIWCRQTWSSAAQAGEAAWSEVREVRSLEPDGFRLVLANLNRLDFMGLTSDGVDLTGHARRRDVEDVRQLIAGLIQGPP
jgi:tetratricopeptide (TPR) repeat protein